MSIVDTYAATSEVPCAETRAERRKEQIVNLERELQALDDAEQLPSPAGALLQTRLGVARHCSGDVPGAIREFKGAKRQHLVCCTQCSADYAWLCRCAGQAKLDQGRDGAALKKYQQARTIHEALGGMGTLEGALLLTALTESMYRLQMLSRQQALQGYGQAEEIHRGLQTLRRHGAWLLRLEGDARADGEELPLALRAYEQALAIQEEAGRVNSQEAVTLLNHMSSVRARAGDRQGAAADMARAYQVFKGLGLEGSLQDAQLSNQMVVAARYMGDQELAEAHRSRARKIFARRGSARKGHLAYGILRGCGDTARRAVRSAASAGSSPTSPYHRARTPGPQTPTWASKPVDCSLEDLEATPRRAPRAPGLARARPAQVPHGDGAPPRLQMPRVVNLALSAYNFYNS